eukprot:COSAG02_NODE_1912_length_10408_cov_8.124551_4_plen_63_part_00
MCSSKTDAGLCAWGRKGETAARTTDEPCCDRGSGWPSDDSVCHQRRVGAVPEAMLHERPSAP